MKRAVLFITSVFVATLFSNAQIFWKITGNGSTKTSYLLGTHHLIDKDSIPESSKILSYIPSVELVVGEMEMNNMLSKQFKLLQSALMKDTTMSQLLTKEEYLMVDAQMKEVVGKGLDKLGKLKPVMLSMLYSVMLFKKEYKLTKEAELIDLEVQKIAKKKKIDVLGLETVDQQISILMNSKSLKKQAEELVQSLKDKNKSVEGMHKMNESYLKGDLESLIQISMEEGQMDKENMEVLCFRRNKNWMDQLQKILPEKSCFIAVGCLHLAGEQGLIQLLRNQGYQVQAVSF